MKYLPKFLSISITSNINNIFLYFQGEIDRNTCEVASQTDKVPPVQCQRCLYPPVNLIALRSDHPYASSPQVAVPLPTPPPQSDPQPSTSLHANVPSPEGRESPIPDQEEDTGEDNDPTYVPDEVLDDIEEDDEDEDSPFSKQVVDEKKFIVFESSLNKLFYQIK